jgi:hypothetical protein
MTLRSLSLQRRQVYLKLGKYRFGLFGLLHVTAARAYMYRSVHIYHDRLSIASAHCSILPYINHAIIQDSFQVGADARARRRHHDFTNLFYPPR